MPQEELSNFHRRRMRIVGNLARQQGLWGTDHARRVVSWAEHLQRPHNSSSLAAHFFQWHGPEWLQQRRIDSGVMRPLTRAMAGYMPKRRDEAIADARD